MEAPGSPGIAPTWTSSAKDMIGTSLGSSRLWFTTGGGILNEVYFPRVDIPQIRDLGFIVADGRGFWCEVKRQHHYSISTPGAGVPAVHIIHRHPRFELTLRIAPDPARDVLLIELTLSGDAELKPYALLAPHLGGTGRDNRAEVFRNRGWQALCAEQGPFALALAAVAPDQTDAWGRTSAGVVGISDGWQDFDRNGAMTWQYGRAGPGNVALTGELPRRCVLALGFASGQESAATLAISALIQPFSSVWHEQVRSWETWQAEKVDHERFPREFHDQLRVSAMVLKAHQDKTYLGAMVASLSVPWGNSSDDIGGYHLVWPRDLVQSAGALLDLHAVPEAREVLRYLIATQLEAGHWAQNQWLGGSPRWGAVQLDEVGFPVLLAARLRSHAALDGIEVEQMVRRALGFLVRNGPVSPQDRWEETAGLNPFTLAVCIAALVAGADFLGGAEALELLQLADDWNAHIEDWCAASSGPICARFGLAGHYLRVAPARVIADRRALREHLPIRNRDPDPGLAADQQISTDFLQLVRFGLRGADDPLVRDTLVATDALLKRDTPQGPAWLRYNEDGYGESDDGAPYNGVGRGRPWPLLTGERGHYALLAGESVQPYLEAMTAFSGVCGLIPEQVWDSAPIAAKFLQPGRPSGSAMPLVWAHAEFVKLGASERLGAPTDRPEAVWLRYSGRKPQTSLAHWSPRMPVGSIQQGQTLRLLLDARALIHWSGNGWTTSTDTLTTWQILGMHAADLATTELAEGSAITFAVQDLDRGEWHAQSYQIIVVAPASS